MATVFATVFVELLELGVITPIIPHHAESIGASAFIVGLLMVPILTILSARAFAGAESAETIP